MKKIGEHLSAIRGLIKKYGRTEEGYTDESLYDLFCDSASDLLKQKFEKLSFVSEQNWMQVCMRIEVGKAHNCDCVPAELDCKVLISTYELPSVIAGMNTSKINIRTISGKQINLISEAAWFRKKDRDTNDYYGSIINKKLVIWNAPLSLKVILVTGVWSNPLDLQNIPSCDPNGEVNGVCFDPLEQLYPLQREYARTVYKMVLESLNIPIQLPQDLTNDSNEFLKI